MPFASGNSERRAFERRAVVRPNRVPSADARAASVRWNKATTSSPSCTSATPAEKVLLLAAVRKLAGRQHKALGNHCRIAQADQRQEQGKTTRSIVPGNIHVAEVCAEESGEPSSGGQGQPTVPLAADGPCSTCSRTTENSGPPRFHSAIRCRT